MKTRIIARGIRGAGTARDTDTETNMGQTHSQPPAGRAGALLENLDDDAIARCVDRMEETLSSYGGTEEMYEALYMARAELERRKEAIAPEKERREREALARLKATYEPDGGPR